MNAYETEYLSSSLAVIHRCNLNCLSSRKYCEAIMDDLLLFTPTKVSHFAKLEDLLKALCKKLVENISKKMSTI